VIGCFCKLGAAPTNKLHGLSPFDFKRDRALELADKKNSSDERAAQSITATAKGKKKKSPIACVGLSNPALSTHLCG
jgi:hypothetical protein